MTPLVFIDGDQGTTGLQVRQWLAGRNDLRLLELPAAHRKSTSHRAEALNSCTLESKYLCTQCSDATLDPSAQPPSNGAKLFSWNSCYDNNDNAATGNSYDGCLEQWGSYAASCLKLSGRAYAPGKRCKNICNTTTCPKGCFKKYGAGNSGTLLASWYQCQ